LHNHIGIIVTATTTTTTTLGYPFGNLSAIEHGFNRAERMTGVTHVDAD
jgi:hypothetical protein